MNRYLPMTYVALGTELLGLFVYRSLLIEDGARKDRFTATARYQL